MKKLKPVLKATKFKIPKAKAFKIKMPKTKISWRKIK